jgi:Cu+-exporting ATPase
MKSKAMVLGMAILFSGLVGSVFADEQIKEENVVRICPICGPEEKMMGKDDISYEYEGKTYHFCSQDCLKSFKDDPAKFVKKMDDAMNEESHEDHESHSDHEGHDDHGHK